MKSQLRNPHPLKNVLKKDDDVKDFGDWVSRGTKKIKQICFLSYYTNKQT